MAAPRWKVFRTEDYWAIWVGLGIVGLALGCFWAGSSLAPYAVTPGTWSSAGEAVADLAKHWGGYLAVFVGFAVVLTASMSVMGTPVWAFLPGFAGLFAGALAVFYLAGWTGMQRYDLGAPLLALVVGLVLGNLRPAPAWLRPALRTEYYIKTGIVLLGATLPLTLIAQAGPIAFVQATLVSVTTWLTIYLAATRLFGLDPRFGAVLGTGGAVCGVSGSIAIGGAVKADKEHISIGIAVVSVWAIVMIFVLTFLVKVMIPAGDVTAWWHLSPGEAGAWVGTSEYADAAGFAVVAELARTHGEAPIYAFTLMKVIGRDIWIGIWALVLSVVSVVFWERKSAVGGPTGRVGVSVIWERFPKFVLGFFAASVIMSVVASMPPEGGGTVPSSAVGEASSGPASPPSDWFEKELKPRVIGPIKKLREWAFVLCFLCIGLSTRFRELATFGLKPFWAFTIGVAVNVPLGYFLTTRLFSSYWRALQ